MWALTVLFWPGVLVHEMAHLLVGRMLLVKTKRLTLIPKMQPDGRVDMGSVMVPHTDRFRFFMIGIAPMLVGLAVLFAALWLAEHYGLWAHWIWWPVVGYTMFQVANTMFLSPSDVQGVWWLVIFLAVVCGLLYWGGWRPSGEWVLLFLKQNEAILVQAQQWLWVPIMVDGGLIGLFWLLPKVFRRRRYG